jgi:hypothetical protein
MPIAAKPRKTGIQKQIELQEYGLLKNDASDSDEYFLMAIVLLLKQKQITKSANLTKCTLKIRPVNTSYAYATHSR